MIDQTILNYLPATIRELLAGLPSFEGKLLEIRLRINRPLQLITTTGDFFVRSTRGRSETYLITREDLDTALKLLTENSLYAMKQELKEGFITIKGGHRVGLTGEVVLKDNQINLISNISSLNYRITREFLGIARGLVEYIFNKETGGIYSTLLISPPLCGKTTILRDLIRLISYGQSELGLSGKKVGVVDERSELGGAWQGIPQTDLGPRTDILDNCPKARGMLLLIRSMSPEVIAVDELGGDRDIRAVEEAVNAGVSLLATIHARDFSSLQLRPGFQNLLEMKAFKRFILLNREQGMGTISAIYDQSGRVVSES